MYRLVAALTLLAICLCSIGCGNEREKGMNRDKDRPKSAEKAAFLVPGPTATSGQLLL